MDDYEIVLQERERLEGLERDAARYRWLRMRNWFDSDIAVVVAPKHAVKPGHDCPSRERLDAFIDEQMTSDREDA